MPSILLTRISRNAKTGPIPVSMSEKETCPDTCPLKQGGCYAQGGPVNIHWIRLSAHKVGVTWKAFLDAVKAFPYAQLWRHNQAGDLPGIGNAIDVRRMAELVSANKGKRGFTYTHKPTLDGQADGKTIEANRKAIANANRNGFTVNLSADTLADADALASLGIAPVATLLPSKQLTNTRTPSGRKVVICPAVTREFTTCATCQLCQRSNRSVIIGFPAHGVSTAKADAVANT